MTREKEKLTEQVSFTLTKKQDDALTKAFEDSSETIKTNFMRSIVVRFLMNNGYYKKGLSQND